MISNTRLSIFAAIVIALALAVVARTVQVQVVQSSMLTKEATRFPTSRLEERANRGRILDRNGNVLAYSEEATMVKINHGNLNTTHPAVIETLSQVLATHTNRPVEQVRKQLVGIAEERAVVTRTVSTLVEQALPISATHALTRALETTITLPSTGRAVPLSNFVLVSPSWRRVYPQGTLAGAVLGGVRYEDGVEIGLMGIELQYDDVLRSTNGERKATGLDRTVTPMSPGGDVVLTLDPQLQLFVEQRLDKALRDFGARNAVAIVMNTETGEIYAMAERDIAKAAFDPNLVAGQIARGTFKGTLNHPAVADATEPGSIIKPLTVLTAREVGKLRPSYQDNGSLQVRGGPAVKNLGNAAYGANIDGTKALANSINTVIGRMALDVGPETFYIQMSRYGFTQRTNIDLPGEAYGMMRIPDRPQTLVGGAWSESDMVRDSFGQSMTATPIQAIAAVNAIANDGRVMRPYLAHSVRRGRDNDETLPVESAQASSSAAARDVREMMTKATKSVIEQGKGKLAIPGYTYAGKTGTADRTTSNLGTTLTTYAGFLPAKAPKLTILVKISDPQAATLAGDVAQPVWRDIAQQAARMANLPPEEAPR